MQSNTPTPKSVAMLILSEDKRKLLLQKREDFRVWGAPGGGMEQGETPEQAAIREAFEETGFITQIDGLLGDYTYNRPGKTNDTQRVFIGRVIGGKAADHGWESVAVDWFDVEQLPRATIRFTRLYVADYLSGAYPIAKSVRLPAWYAMLLGGLIKLRNVRNKLTGRA
ncbi:MAG TPA: NUDIX domain-containing protein [Thermoflexales bacterium]|nr:NUDIX domain-containing protein [Thermoflexales bacterium]HQZ22115.1 NUDIX domain-containing protein [Thermoflexales bacterium]